MLCVLEVFCPQVDPFFSLTSGWHAVVEEKRYGPGEPIPAGTAVGTIVFDSNDSRFNTTVPSSPTFAMREVGADCGLWLPCQDGRTRVHLAAHRKSSSATVAVVAPAHARKETFKPSRRKSVTKLDATSPLAGVHTKQVFQLQIPVLTFQVFSWPELLLSKRAHCFELEITMPGGQREVMTCDTSELVEPAMLFNIKPSKSQGMDLGISLTRLSSSTKREGGEKERISRVTHLDENLDGYKQGVRVGDLLVDEHAMLFKRMEVRRITNLRARGPNKNMFVDLDLLDQDNVATLELYLVQDSISNEFPEMEPLEQSFQMNKNKRIALGNCKLNLLTTTTAPTLLSCSFDSHYLHVDYFQADLKRRIVPPHEVCIQNLRFSTGKHRIFLSLVDQAAEGKFDLALVSLHGMHVETWRYDDGSSRAEFTLGTFQLDDLQPGAIFPVCFAPTKYKVDRGPFFQVSLELGASRDVILLNLLDLLVGEANIKISARLLAQLTQFSLSNEPPPEVTATSTPSPPQRVRIGVLDIKPMRLNVTFVNNANAGAATNERLFPLYSTLVSAFTSVSNAPIKFSALVLKNEVKTVDALNFALRHYYVNQVKFQLFQIAGSSEILGSPVQLLGDVSHGVFSFFYEPALALSMGEQQRRGRGGSGGGIGAGISRGSSAVVNSGAGSVLESLSKVTRAVAKTLATTSGDSRFAEWLDAQLNLESFYEPINAVEGVNRGCLVFVKTLLDSLVAMFKSPNRLLQRFAGLLLKPSSGFFALISQFSAGVRNTLVDSGSEADFVFPARLAKPLEFHIQAYSAARCAGFMLARIRLGGAGGAQHTKLVMNQICQVEEEDAESGHTLLTVVNMVLTDTWLMACREIGLDLFCVPLECIERFDVYNNNTLVRISTLGREYVFTCQSAQALKREWENAFKLKTGKLPESAISSDAPTTALTIRRAVSMEASEIDVAGVRLGSAQIQSFGEWEDGVTRYHVLLRDEGGKISWTVERRYREFLEFRDRACEFLQVSRRCMPLPARRAWHLSAAEREQRLLGLQALLDQVQRIDLLRESEVLRQFLCRGADNVTRSL